MQFEQFLSFLENRLTQELPGKEAQFKMASLRRIANLNVYSDYSGARKSGVLILFFPEQGKINTVVIKRPEYDGVHSGQISFPGGRWEEGDTDLTGTALREAQEEIGIDPSLVTILGHLSDLYIPPSNSLVFPAIGFIGSKPEMSAQPKEVEKIICFPLDELFLPETLTIKTVSVGNWSAEVPCFYVRDQIIWGATAMIISELLEIIRPNFL